MVRYAWAAILVACGGEGSGSADPSSGRVIEPVAVQVIGTSDAISHIVDVATESDGTIWVLNAAEPYLIAMRPDGTVLRTWGRRGGGPGEFRTPNTFVPDAATGILWLYDRGHHALLRVNGPEEQVETIPVPREDIPNARVASTENLGAGSARVWVRAAEGGFVFAVSRDGSSPFTRLWNTDLVLLTADGATRIALPMAAGLGDPASRYGGSATEFLPFPLWALCPDGSMAVYDPLGNRISRVSADGSPADSVALPAERRVEITMDRIFRMAFAFMRDQAPAGQRPDSATMYANLAGQWNDIQVRSSPVFPEYADLQCSQSRTLWLQQFDADQGMMGRSPLWFRIDAAGDITSVRFPDTFRPLRFESQRVLGIHRGEFDIESIASVALPRQDS